MTHHILSQPRGEHGKLIARPITPTRVCTKCREEKPYEMFHKGIKGKRIGHCKVCEAARTKAWRAANPEKSAAHAKKNYEKNKPRFTAHVMNRIAKKRNATPPWAEHQKIAVLYKKAKEWGMHVDHIVPLRHPKVCGLHVWHNLQLLAPRENMSKQNRSWPDMPEEA